MLHYQLGLNSFVFGSTSITIMFPLSSKKDSKVFCYRNVSLSNRIIFHCFLLNWHLHINYILLPPCSRG